MIAARRCRDCSMEPNIVDQESMHIIERRKHLHDFFRDRRQLATAGTLRR
jgi:hypothetical protein